MPAIGRIVWKLKAANAKCADGVTRTAFLRSYWDGQRFCPYGDTYFTVPAYVKVQGKQVRGFITSEGEATHFHASKRSKHAHLIKPKPAKE